MASTQQLLATAIRLQTNNLLSEADAIYSRLLAQEPGNCDALHLMGTIALQRGDYPTAIELITLAIAINKSVAQYHNSLGMAFKLSNKTDRATECFQEALKINPKLVAARFNLANTLRDQGLMPLAINEYRKVLEQTPSDYRCHSDMLLALQCIDGPTAQEIYEEHCRWGARHAAHLLPANRSYLQSINTDRRLRIGYISPDFWNHVVPRFFYAALKNHDRAKFEVYCYASVDAPDHITKLLQAEATVWRNIAHMSDSEAAELIRDDQVDILVDLTGHAGDSRMRICAYKPAPVQVTWLGYPDTTGVASIDYRITDALADPPGVTDRFHCEKLVRLPTTAWSYHTFVNAACRDGPAQRGEPFTFGSFNNFMKLTDAMLDNWVRILHAVPGSRLFLKAVAFSDPVACRKVELAFLRGRLSLDRLILRPADASHLQHMERYAEMDIALDPFPYQGTTTTCEALWMGVPVITLAGTRHVSRVGVSLLTTIGLPEYIATTVDQYIQIAVQSAREVEKLAMLRRTLRQRFEQSPLGDGPAFARDLETAYQSMWQHHCAAV